jgi:formamidopyrimidine-DNA glycosylase
MPEKPEVMTVVKALKPKIIGKTITKCNIKWNNIIATNIDEFKSNIINQKILDITTRGKFIVVILTDYVLLIHLRMEGKFTFRTPKETFDKHEHVEFILDDTVAWRYKDTRKFGKMYLVDKDKYLEVEPLKSLGKDFYDDSLTGSYLYEKIHKKKLPIKTVLLDQSIISGIGNIYDDEILFMSKIKPTRVSSEVTKKECDKIVDSTKEVLSAAEKLGGTTIKSFTSEEGVHGLFQNKLLVHQKLGEKCPECGNPIIKIKVNGRGTYYCSKCQK